MSYFGDARDRFFDHRFGLFIHWGLYALPAWHEQILWRGEMSRADYEGLIHRFDPQAYNPEAWLDCAQQAGMSYVCFTTKHHDGFCMFDSKHTDYKITNTPYGRDVLEMLAEACRKRDIRLSLYYSLPDWHHPNYPNLGRHHEMFGPRPYEMADEDAYLDYVEKQIRELCTNYGELYQFFWDVNVAGFADPRFNELIRELQPGILINDRGPSAGDYSTPERHVPDEMVFDSPTEACQSIGRESWGYRAEEDYYTHRFLMHSIDKILAMGGNYLLNVGPTAEGSFPFEAERSLERIGRWYKQVQEAFIGTRPASYLLRTTQGNRSRYDGLLLTRRRNTVYVHAADGLQANGMVLPGIRHAPSEAIVLNTGTTVETEVDTVPWRWTEQPCLRIKNIGADRLLEEPVVVRLEFPDEVVA